MLYRHPRLPNGITLQGNLLLSEDCSCVFMILHLELASESYEARIASHSDISICYGILLPRIILLLFLCLLCHDACRGKYISWCFSCTLFISGDFFLILGRYGWNRTTDFLLIRRDFCHWSTYRLLHNYITSHSHFVQIFFFDFSNQTLVFVHDNWDTKISSFHALDFRYLHLCDLLVEQTLNHCEMVVACIVHIHTHDQFQEAIV